MNKLNDSVLDIIYKYKHQLEFKDVMNELHIKDFTRILYNRHKQYKIENGEKKQHGLQKR